MICMAARVGIDYFDVVSKLWHCMLPNNLIILVVIIDRLTSNVGSNLDTDLMVGIPQLRSSRRQKEKCKGGHRFECTLLPNIKSL